MEVWTTLKWMKSGPFSGISFGRVREEGREGVGRRREGGKRRERGEEGRRRGGKEEEEGNVHVREGGVDDVEVDEVWSVFWRE
jgi:hypothetical protein